MEKETETLEKQFDYYKQVHKYAIVQACLIMNVSDIYENYLLKNYKYQYTNLSVEEKAIKITEDLYDNHKEVFELVYEICWDLIKNVLPEDRLFH